MAFHPFDFISKKSQIIIKQKIHSRRKRRGIRSFNHFKRTIKDSVYKIKCAKDIVQNLENYGPAGLFHIYILCDIIRRPIKIWNSDGNLYKIIGQTELGCPIDVEYHTINNEIGHWTLRHGKDPDNINVGSNNCLFSVIGSLTEQDPLELRRRTILKLRSDLQELTNRINDILQSEGNGGAFLMIGGARYIGNSPSHAARILDLSQNRYCHNCHKTGHPRGHASSPKHAMHSNQDCVEAYSSSGHKTAFLSRDDQDYVTNLALRTRQAQDAMRKLNEGSETIAVHISVCDLNGHDLPKAKEYFNGVPITDATDIKRVTLVLRHQAGQYKNPEADVFITTCYPQI